MSLRSDDWDDDEEGEADYYVRHLGTNVVLTTLGGPIDKRVRRSRCSAMC